jgi:hypothetical protein
VRIGQGRDAADTSFATIFAGAVMKKMELSMQPGTGQRNYPEYTTAPISNSCLFRYFAGFLFNLFANSSSNEKIKEDP